MRPLLEDESELELFRRDPTWRMAAYRFAIEGLDVGWDDACRLARHRVTRRIAGQLYDALGSIGANLSEGYSRSSGADRVRMYEYALGSAREAVTWYFAGRRVLGREVVRQRLERLRRIIALLMTMIPRERNRRIRPAEG
jgi:four helix bundle protein